MRDRGTAVDLKNIQLPKGLHIQKSGGRPKKDAKFVGITLARWWQIEHCKQKASSADRWILEKWGKNGVTDEAHIRSTVRRMTTGLMAPLRTAILVQNEQVTLAISLNQKKGWMWYEPLTEAIPLLGSITMTQDQTNPLAVNFGINLQSPD